MATLTGSPDTFYRGATILFTTTFTDSLKVVAQPAGAEVVVAFLSADDSSIETETIAMTPPTAPATVWTALWDSRGAGPGPVWASIHTTNPLVPEAVQDLQFVLAANNANVLTF